MKHPGTLLVRQRTLFAVLLAFAVAGCTVQFVSRYDADTEQMINTVQRQVETLLVEIESTIGAPEVEYEHYVDAYKQLHIDAAMLNTRAQAIELNDQTIEQTEILVAWLQNLESLHKDPDFNGAAAPVLRAQAQSIFVAMLKLELAKKRQLDSPISDGE